MATLTTVAAALKTLAGTSISNVPVFWFKENNVLPDPPSPFVWFEFEVHRSELVGFGGGRFSNLYRHFCELRGYLAVERGRGLAYGAPLSEAIAATFRSYRDTAVDVSCFDSTSQPTTDVTVNVTEGVEVGNYDWYLITTDLHFDQTG